MASAREAKKAGRVLLPDSVRPSRYAVTLEPDFERFVFAGTVDIAVEVTAATAVVHLHAKELSIASARFAPADGSTMTATGLSFDLEYDSMTISFGKELPVGEGTLSIVFTGQLNDQMAGFYRSSYKTVEGEVRTMGSTQFEALDARRAFPCWDEPAIKAVFSVTLVVDAKLCALSNMPEKQTTLLPGDKKRVVFMDSPVMSTYLLAWCVGEFDFVSQVTTHGVLIRVFTPPGKAEQGLFSLDCAVRTLDLYDDFFGVPYPLPKLDMIAIPEFACGAMENWGLVTYREVDVLIDPVKASSQQRQRVCTVVTHELAHQWFGNLVTMCWWDDLWLNEGFASFMQTWAADHLFPEWKMWDQFITDDLASALSLDAMRTSHPIQVPIAHAQEVDEVFDAISYCKGACVIRMLHVVLGEENFQQGLRLYMERHAYGNTETYDLWAALGEASPLPVDHLMSSWTETMGFPVIVVKNCDIKDDSVELELEQTWFLADGSEEPGDAEKTWTIPIVAVARGHNLVPLVQICKDKTFTLSVPHDGGANPWVKLNFGQTVPYRVAYTPEMWKALAQAVRNKELLPVNRAGLVLDAYALTKAGYMKPRNLVDLLSAFVEENDAIVWDALAIVIRAIDKVLLEEDSREAFVRFAGRLVTPAAQRVGWESSEDDGHLDKLLRATLIELVSHYSSDADMLAEARKRFDAVVEAPLDPSACPSEYRVSVFRMVLRLGGDAEYNAVKTLHTAFTDDVDKKSVFLSLGYTPSAANKLAILEWALSGQVKRQDCFYPFASVSASSAEGLAITWDYFKDNLQRLKTMFGKNSSIMSAFIGMSCQGFVSETRLQEIEEFFTANPVPQCQRRISQVKEGMRTNIAFLKKLEQDGATSGQFWDDVLTN